ncbi:hypothetical protein Glove_115g107 [Diversispora epigaea]|uniref:Uncharacterized protein n=1 Tax=Diversispora epigaea TaxID=1348612 RepID=A0A397J144_9GLOM|nr:hypothetical protein Glove_115g107 [Diversispora epigaea]
MSGIISLNFRIHGSTIDEEVFVIEIPKEKKVDMLKPLVKKRLAPLTNNVPSTKINLQTASGMRMKAMAKISNYYDRDINEDEIHVLTKAIYPLCEEAELRVSNSCKAKKSGIRLKPFIINLKLKTINENLEFWLDSTKAIYPLCEEAELRVSNSCKAKKSGIRLVRFG